MVGIHEKWLIKPDHLRWFIRSGNWCAASEYQGDPSMESFDLKLSHLSDWWNSRNGIRSGAFLRYCQMVWIESQETAIERRRRNPDRRSLNSHSSLSNVGNCLKMMVFSGVEITREIYLLSKISRIRSGGRINVEKSTRSKDKLRAKISNMICDIPCRLDRLYSFTKHTCWRIYLMLVWDKIGDCGKRIEVMC